MNISTDKKTYKIVHTNNNPKKKVQHKKIRKNAMHNKNRNKPMPHYNNKTTRTTKKPATPSIAIATNQPILDAAFIIPMPTPISTTPLTLPNDLFNVTDQDKSQGFTSQQYDEELEVNYAASTAAAAAIHKMEGTESITQQHPSTVPTATKITQVAAPVIGVFGGIALIAAAMFYVVRKRKRNSMLIDNVSKKKDDYDDHKKYHDGEMHDISLLDDENDEAIMAMDPPPKLAPATTNTTNMNRHIYNNSAVINVPKNHPVNNLPNMTDCSREENYSRTNSINPPPLSYRNSSSCRTSTTSTIYTDALMSPTSTVFGGAHLSSFLMIAERQQLQHQRPSILDHFNNNNEILSSRSTPIETYKAQLANLTTVDDDGNDDDDEQKQEQGENALPFFTIVDLTDVY